MKLKSVILSVLLLSVFMISCQKHEELVVNQNGVNTKSEQVDIDYSNYEPVFEYYLDNNQVEEGLFASKNDLITYVIGSMDDIKKINSIEVYGFTSEELFNSFGLENIPNFREQLLFESQIHEYVIANNVDEYYEKYGKAPQSYLDYEKILSEKILKIDYNSKALMCILSKGYNGTGGIITYLIGGFPYMGLDWNNKVSAVCGVGLGNGCVSLFDDTFYRNRLTGFAGVFNWYNLEGFSLFANDATSSVNVRPIW
jgi:hypothetical protein